MAKHVFGIDLGTTYSCIAYVDETGRPTVVNNMEGSNTTPSVVNFASEDQVVVGEVAKENAVIDPDHTVQLVKTLMGKTDFAINYNGEDKTPEEVSSYILRKVTGDAAQQLDTEVKDVVITCPAYFGTAERNATKKAGEIAGLNVLAIINEPTAAALFYGVTKATDPKTVLVFDLGGGTFDVTIMSVSSDTIQVICSDGDHDLGGKLWDEAIMNYLADQFTADTGVSTDDIDEYAQQDLRLKAEKAKQQLSSRDKVPVMLDIAGQRDRVELTREKFDEITADLIQVAVEKTQAAIDVAKDRGYTVDEILLVGGSTRMPQVTEAIKKNFNMDPKILEPDEAVAKGAAIYAVSVFMENRKIIEEALQSGKVETNDKGEQIVHTEDGSEVKVTEEAQQDLDVDTTRLSIGGASGGAAPKIVNATTKSYALKTIDKNEHYWCTNLITKNDPMPDGVVSVTERFGTHVANQESVELEVYESDYMEAQYEPEEDLKIGDATLEIPNPLPANAPLDVTFTLAKDGTLHIKGVDVTNNAVIEADLKATAIMDDDTAEALAAKTSAIQVQ